MRRRQALLSTALLPLLSTVELSARKGEAEGLKPPRLKAGDTVRLIAPGYGTTAQGWQQAVANMERLGLVCDYQGPPADSAYMNPDEDGNFLHFSDSEANRIEEIHRAFADPQVKAVWCVRGGYGCTPMLPKLDYDLIRRNPKIIIGYSDVTALLQAVHQQTGLTTYHGPIAKSGYNAYTFEEVKSILFEEGKDHLIRGSVYSQPLVGGVARGELIGGNLTLLAALAGTPYAADCTGKIVLIEDVGERPYSLDRMLVQLRQACKLDKAAGIIFGDCSDCWSSCDEESAEKDRKWLLPVLRQNLAGLGVPVLYNFPIGHGVRQSVFPIGLEAELDSQAATLRFLESPTA